MQLKEINIDLLNNCVLLLLAFQTLCSLPLFTGIRSSVFQVSSYFAFRTVAVFKYEKLLSR